MAGSETVLYRVVPDLNMARYYAAEIEPSLFGDYALVRRWGRIGQPNRVRIELYASRGEAELHRVRLLASKLAKGYRPHVNVASLSHPKSRMRGSGQKAFRFFAVVQ